MLCGMFLDIEKKSNPIPVYKKRGIVLKVTPQFLICQYSGESYLIGFLSSPCKNQLLSIIYNIYAVFNKNLPLEERANLLNILKAVDRV